MVVGPKAPPTPISGTRPHIGRRLSRGGDRGEPAWMGADGRASGRERPRHAAWMGAERPRHAAWMGAERSGARGVLSFRAAIARAPRGHAPLLFRMAVRA